MTITASPDGKLERGAAQPGAEERPWVRLGDAMRRRAAHATTTGQSPRISIEETLRVEPDLPPLPEKERIAVRLSGQRAAAGQARAACQARLAAIESGWPRC